MGVGPAGGGVGHGLRPTNTADFIRLSNTTLASFSPKEDEPPCTSPPGDTTHHCTGCPARDGERNILFSWQQHQNSDIKGHVQLIHQH